MIIGVDAGCLGVRDKRLKVGVYNFAANLLIELSKIDTHNQYLLYSFHPIDNLLMSKLGPNMKNIVVRPVRGWLKIWLPIRMLRDHVSLFIALGQSSPPRLSPKIHILGVVYDIAFEKFPAAYPESYGGLHKNTKLLINKSDQIIAISEQTKKDIINKYNYDPKKITTVTLGVRKFSEEKSQLKRNNPYFLFTGSLKKIKNIPTLLKAFEKYVITSKLEAELVIVGGNKWMDEEIDTTFSALSMEAIEKISFIGYANDSELLSLYRHAIAFVSPSFYEGFGLPVVEAMSVGCPIIASNAGSFPEVIDDAGILLDPLDVDGLADALVRIHSDEDLKSELSKKSLSRAKNFNWETCAKQTYAVISDLNK